MNKRNIVRSLVLCGVLALSISALSCGPKFALYKSYFIRGDYTITDLADGKLTITNIQAFPKLIKIYFSNNRVLTISPRFRFDINDNRVSVAYHGHYWSQENEPDKTRKDIILKIDEICFDDFNNTFYMKFSADFKVWDCEKPVLSFRCNKLLAQNDMEWYLNKSSVISQIVEAKKEKEKKK